MKSSAARMSCGLSPTIVVCARSTPSSRRRSASQGPLRSLTRPVRTSVPVTTMPARTLTSGSLAARLFRGGERLAAARLGDRVADRLAGFGHGPFLAVEEHLHRAVAERDLKAPRVVGGRALPSFQFEPGDH